MKSKIDLQVIEKIKKRRLELKVSQAELAYGIGVSLGFIGQVESLHYPAKYSVTQLYQIAQYLECAPGDFFPHIDNE
ncbi:MULTISPECIES: helix-turn-helix domain-containing protein [Porphyromonadaceae]|uniref:HTH cro/C1-type domain-containing protein n=1 Tax=Sanguibacteroides justesenii TaxID=1547597 RepID=A0A0C3M8V1_9PORP|nr:MULTISPECIES: helix-turn-helix transcriptional regulator [Porphyromonadaceae]KIO42833.1 hypothetical protein BA92_13265 [Sanguibacteroides justesenii]KIO45048.1 hypothetical protein IE90_06285 [Sanguibacteroides justesenii]MCR9010941.1 helix-turn-helix transcriptional regulator [Gabonibacter chumensis]PXZ44151.1 XRE family transcriptional regulator [Sanguibacteroides justesenii]